MWQPQEKILLPEGHRIKVSLLCMGEFFAGETALAVATTADQIILAKYPFGQKNQTTLNGNLPITAIQSARFPNRDTDVLLFANKNHLQAFEVSSNSDVFATQLPDGGNVVLIGQPNSFDDTIMVWVGGNCSIQGFDHQGIEKSWLVTGDNVRSLAIVEDDLFVGSDDYDIRIFHGEDLIREITETHVVTHLKTLEEGMFAYALGNGTVGVYKKYDRLWRVKSKNKVTCIEHSVWQQSFKSERISVLMTGWQGGKVDMRNIRTGEVLMKYHMDDTVAGIVSLAPKYPILLAISVTGQIRGLNLKSSKLENQDPQETIRQLLARKQELMLELSHYSSESTVDQQFGIPARTRLQTYLAVVTGSEEEKSHVQIRLSTNNETVIRAAIVFAEGMFKGETEVKHPHIHNIQPTLSVALYPPTDIPIDIHIKALVGYIGSNQYHVFEVTRQLPRFSMYAYIGKLSSSVDAQGSVQFTIRDRVQRLLLWMNKNFLLEPPSNDSNELDIAMVCLRDGKELGLFMNAQGVVTITTDNMYLAGDLVQSLVEYFNVKELISTANFPQEEAACRELLETMQQLDEAKRKLAMELGDRSALVRGLIVRAEDARLLGDYPLQQKLLQELRLIANDLRQRHEVRVVQYADSVNVARQLKLIVQNSMRLRVAPPTKNDPLKYARNALSDYDPNPVINLMRHGNK